MDTLQFHPHHQTYADLLVDALDQVSVTAKQTSVTLKAIRVGDTEHAFRSPQEVRTGHLALEAVRTL